MSNPSPQVNADDRADRRQPAIDATPAWRPSRRLLLVAGLAFVIGLMLFLGLWWRDRGNDFYRADGVPQTAAGQQFEPLPAPLPAEDSSDNASGMAPPPAAGIAQSRTTQMVPAPVAQPIAPGPVPPSGTNSASLASGNKPVPIASPAPAYPIDALRNGESGTVLLRIHVDAAGLPVAVDLIQSSRSRALDRAATAAVKRWRFRPAQRNGEPVSGEVQVPISFNVDQ